MLEDLFNQSTQSVEIDGNECAGGAQHLILSLGRLQRPVDVGPGMPKRNGKRKLYKK